MRFPYLAAACALCFLMYPGCVATSPPSNGIDKTLVIDPPKQGDPIPDSVTVIAGPEYYAGSVHQFLFGEHYRDLWTTPIEVPVLHLDTFAGGLTPIKQGGGFQTKSLRLQGKNGKKYAFRSINKDPKAVLPPDLQDTFAADVVQDQISSSNPVGAVVVDVLADAVGVLHAHPVVCLMPDDERLGEFRETFAGILGIIEEYPDEGEDGKPGFANSTKVVSTLKLFERLEEDNTEMVDERAYLKARLLDIFVGDWDRHIDQWKWARFKEGKIALWYPVPRDRDQAFARFDGLLPVFSRMAITQFESFYEDFNNIYSLTFSGRYLDRRLLVSLDKQAWDSVTSFVISQWTDTVIDDAVGRLPIPYYEKRGAWLSAALKSRRARLRDASHTYYRQLADYVDIHLSDDPEYVEINRIDDDRVQVQVSRMRKKSPETESRPFLERTFFRDETKELRLYLHGGDDKLLIRGEVGSSITVRAVGGGGDDDMMDESIVHGVFLGFIPFIPDAEHATFFYDDKGKNSLKVGPSGSIDTAKYERPSAGVAQN